MPLKESVAVCAAVMGRAGKATSYAAWVIGREAESLLAHLPVNAKGRRDIQVEFAAALFERCPWWGKIGPDTVSNYRRIYASYPNPSEIPYSISVAVRLAKRPELRKGISRDISDAEAQALLAANRKVVTQCETVTRKGRCTMKAGHADTHRTDQGPFVPKTPETALEAPRTNQTEVCGWNYGQGPCGLPKGHEGIHKAEVRAEVAIPAPESEVVDAHIVRDVYELEVGPLIADLLNALESNPRDIAASSLLMKGLRDIRSLVDELEEM